MENQIEFKQYWENEFKTKYKKVTPIFIIYTIMGFVASIVYDYYVINHLFSQFLVFRLTIIAIGICLLILHRFKLVSSRFTVLIFISAYFLFLSYGASQITQGIHLATWNLNIILLVVLWPAIILIENQKIALFYNLYFLATYVLFYLLFSTVELYDLLVNGGILLVVTLFIIPLAYRTKYIIEKNNTKLKYDIELKDNQIKILKNKLSYMSNYEFALNVSEQIINTKDEKEVIKTLKDILLPKFAIQKFEYVKNVSDFVEGANNSTAFTTNRETILYNPTSSMMYVRLEDEDKFYGELVLGGFLFPENFNSYKQSIRLIIKMVVLHLSNIS